MRLKFVQIPPGLVSQKELCTGQNLLTRHRNGSSALALQQLPPNRCTFCGISTRSPWKKRIKDSFTIHHWFILIQLRVLAITLNASRESFNSERNSKRIFRTSHFLLLVSSQIDSLEILENLVTSFGGIWTKSNWRSSYLDQEKEPIFDPEISWKFKQNILFVVWSGLFLLPLTLATFIVFRFTRQPNFSRWQFFKIHKILESIFTRIFLSYDFNPEPLVVKDCDQILISILWPGRYSPA